ncbi:MAG: ATP synthase F1 subunit gamma [Candidatus Krumholzibacteria bacterium]|nr:ATP synthase F1 subunit gamma [Candidatus Krumholzibacteria bacterium]
MPSLLDIRARIKAVENIKKITRAMQLVAAAKFNRAQNRARSARPYARELDEILGVLAAISEDEFDTGAGSDVLDLSFVEGETPLRVHRAGLFEQSEVKRPGVILVTADRGLAGAFNTRLIRAADRFIRDHPQMDSRLITIGKKGNAYFKRRDVSIIHHVEGLSDRLQLDELKRVTQTLVGLFASGEVDGLYLIYSQFKSAMRSDVTIEKFLSIPPVHKKDDERKSVYILEPDREAVYETLIPLYATTKIFATMADSFASEYGARMVAMQLATSNAEEMLESQIILRNRMRQAMITKELAEIVGGSAAQVS